jgi:hypothetical protein
MTLVMSRPLMIRYRAFANKQFPLRNVDEVDSMSHRELHVKVMLVVHLRQGCMDRHEMGGSQYVPTPMSPDQTTSHSNRPAFEESVEPLYV